MAAPPVLDVPAATQKAGFDTASRSAARATTARPAPPKMHWLVSDILFRDAVRIVEFLVVALVGAGTFRVIAPAVASLPIVLIDIVVFDALLVLAMQRLGAFRISALCAPGRTLMRLALVWVGLFGGSALGIYAAVPGTTTLASCLAIWGVLGFALLCAERLVLFLVTSGLLRSRTLGRRVAIVGGGEAAQALLDVLFAQGREDLHIVGLFDDRKDRRSPDVVRGVPKLGTVDDLVRFARDVSIDLVIFALPCSAETRLRALVDKLWVLPVDIRVAAHSAILRYVRRSYSYIGTCPLIDIIDKPISDRKYVIKLLFDKIVGLALLVLFAPLALLVAAAVKLDSRGPVLFRQTRYGFNNRPIEVLKFRSMYVEQLDFKADRLVTRDDPRVTRVGRIIRKLSLDELPQLYDVVFRGNLSLVGPRPHAPQAKVADRHYEEIVGGYFARHRVRPGVTGWAQVNGWRGETDTLRKIEARIECDLYYIENWSILMDIRVLLWTPISVFTAKNAF